MLTHSSELLPQIACPMDEDPAPPNPFCSAPPPHCVAPLPLLPLCSITPSRAKDGASEHRRSGRIQSRAQTPRKQSHVDVTAAKKPPRQSPSPDERQSRSMVQVSPSKQPEAEGLRLHEDQNMDGSRFTFAAEQQNTEEDQTTKSDMDACGYTAIESPDGSPPSPRGWVIGPLFRTFKSKISSFTEIVWSPAKLFKANSPPPGHDPPDKLCESEPRDNSPADAGPSGAFLPGVRSETENQETNVAPQRLGGEEEAQAANRSALACTKRLVFDADVTAHNSEQMGDRARSPDSVPLRYSQQGGSQPSVSVSASQEPEVTNAAEEQLPPAVQPKPLPRKQRSESKKVIANRTVSERKVGASDPEVIDVQPLDSTDMDRNRLLSSSVCYTQLDRDCSRPDDGNNSKSNESCSLVRQSLRTTSSASRKTLKCTVATEQQENQLIPDSNSAAGLGRSKRALKGSCHSQELTRRKKLRADVCAETEEQDLLNPASESSMLRMLRPQRKEAAATNSFAEEADALKPLRKRPAVTTRANRKGKDGKETLLLMNNSALNARTEGSPDDTTGCFLDNGGFASENAQKVSRRSKPCGKRLKGNLERMDLETTVAVASAGQAEQEPLLEAPNHADKKKRQSISKSKKPQKRKSPIQASAVTEAVVSHSPLELTPTDFKTPPSVTDANSKTENVQPPKRSKKGVKGAVKSSQSNGIQNVKQGTDNRSLIVKKGQTKEGKSKNSIDPVYFEMSPFDSEHQPDPPPPQSQSECPVKLNDGGECSFAASVVSVADDTEVHDHSSNGVARLRSSARRVDPKSRRSDKQRRRCIVLHSRTHKGEETSESVTMEEADLPTSESNLSRHLSRSQSCPEIPSLRPPDATWTAPSLQSPQHSHSRTRASPPNPSLQTPPAPHAHKSFRRARRHTVCSLEVEREIAPRCLRKEVHPRRRSAPLAGAGLHFPFHCHSLEVSPSCSISALASNFLSSPLAFLSKRVDGAGAAVSPSAFSHVFSPSESCTSGLGSPTSHLSVILQRCDSPRAHSGPNSSEQMLECETERRQIEEEEEEDGEDTSSSSQEYEDITFREEKAFSDSEIKVEQKNKERGKVSSIRIRKALPKPQNNLTPMGLPKPIRVKKKEFSLEEIYTNKNFNKPPESRLETIFEVALHRRNGGESWFGQRRVKRLVEFPELGEVRKPKKPLVGVGKASCASSSSRTRRGGAFAKDEPPLSVQDADSLLCAKLDQLNLWLIHDQNHS